MTPQQIEAMKLALDLATMHHTDDGYAELRAKVRSASKEALAEHAMQEVQRLGQEIEQKPVKITHKHEWFRTGEMKVGQMRCISCGTWGQEEAPQRKPLTEDELADLWYKQSLDWLEFARAIEAAHGIKE